MAVGSVSVFVLVGLLWGSEWLLTRELDLPSLGALALRYAIAALLLLGVIVARRIRWPSRSQVLIAVVSGIGFSVLPVLLTGWAGGRVSPGLTVVVLAMTPLIAALMEGRASGGLLAALIGGVGGTALVSAQGLSFSLGQWPGAAALLASAVSIAGAVILAKRRLTELPVVMMAALQLLTGAVFLASWSLWREGPAGFAWKARMVSVEALLALAGSAVALPLYYWLLRRMESYQLTALQWVVTVVSVAEGLLFVREAPGWRMVAGGAAMLASLGMVLNARDDAEEPVTLR